MKMMNSYNRGRLSNRDVARGGSIRDRCRNEAKKCTCHTCFISRICRPEQEYAISDDDFVEHPYGYGLKNKKW